MTKKNLCFFILSLISLGFIFMNSCRKDEFTTNSFDKLIFSKDTVQFDTIFTNIGSATNYFVVKNPNKSKSIKIDKIFVAKNTQSKYKLNINGNASNSLDNVVLAPGDSIHIFVMVNIDPNRDDMVEQDSIIFMSNGNFQNVKLVSYGQDVTLINGKIFKNDTVWTSQKPILIYNSAMIDTLATLTIQAGVKVYFHKGSSLFVKGTIKVNGEQNNRVLFAGDRLERAYSEVAGQWGAYRKNKYGETIAIFGGLHLLAGSRNNEITNADIKNAIIGLQVDSVVTSGVPTVKLKNTNIENSQVAGLYSLGAHIEAENCVFANSGKYNVGCIIGGKYLFTHCTLANYWVGNRQVPQLLFNNYYKYVDNNGNTHISHRPLEYAYFGNCIVYGSREDELQIDYSQGADMNLHFENCLLKYKDTTFLKSNGSFSGNIFNENPKFKNIKSPYDYELDTLSSAKDRGDFEIGQRVPFDQLGISRTADNKPDIGAYERQE